MKKIIIEMENGDVMKGELYPEVAPITVENFEKLASESVHINSVKVEDKEDATMVMLEARIPRRVNVEDVIQDLCKCSIVREFKGI